MVFYKRVEVNDLRAKYGFSQKGLIAQEPIKKGERIWSCACGEKDLSFTRAQLLDLIKQHPRLNYFICSFSYMIDDDVYAMPETYMDELNNDECAYFNHSCAANCGFTDAFGDDVIAMRDIEPGEELTYHYGTLESEASLIYGLLCKCDSINCAGRLTFDNYRDAEFVAKYYEFMTPYLKQKVADMSERWYSNKCYVKRVCPAENSSSPVEYWPVTLAALESIKKDELVAKFKDEVGAEKHYVGFSDSPSCYLVGNEVFASADLAPETEITISI